MDMRDAATFTSALGRFCSALNLTMVDGGVHCGLQHQACQACSADRYLHQWHASRCAGHEGQRASW